MTEGTTEAIGDAGGDDTGGSRIQLLVTSSPQHADHWAEVLDAVGVNVLVEITDAQMAEPGSSPLIGVLGARPMEFVHVLTIPMHERDRAMAALVDAGWDGREGLRAGQTPDLGRMGVGALLALAGIAAFILLRTAAG